MRKIIVLVLSILAVGGIATAVVKKQASIQDVLDARPSR